MGLGGSAALRWVCIVVLGAALLLTLPRGALRGAPFGQLLDDVRGGRVTDVQLHVEGGQVSAVWHEGPLRWYRADAPFDAERQLIGAGTAPESRGLSFSYPRADRVWIQAVKHADEPAVLAGAAGVLWLVLFLVMLLSGDHPYANRWAWFWLFVVGGIGPILMLFKEPRPLVSRRRRPVPRAPRLFAASRPSGRTWPPGSAPEPLRGGTGLAYAVLWAVGLSIGGSLLAAALT